MSPKLLFWAMAIVGIGMTGVGGWSVLSGNDGGVLLMAAGTLLLAAGVLILQRRVKGDAK